MTGGWILSQRKSQGGQAKHVKHTEEREVTVERMQESGAVGAASCPERPNVLFTGFSRSDLHRLKQSVNCLGGSAVRDLPAGRTAAETRVVVRCTTSTCGLQIAGARTIKYLDAVLAGAWVLSPEWVYASMRAGHWLEEADFELQGDTAKMGGPPQGRRHGPELFAGLRFHFVSQARGGTWRAARLARARGGRVGSPAAVERALLSLTWSGTKVQKGLTPVRERGRDRERERQRDAFSQDTFIDLYI